MSNNTTTQPQPQFDRNTVRAMLDLFTVEGSDFSRNQSSDLGSINMVLFTDKGDPFERFAGEQKVARFLKRVNGEDTYETRPSGFYRLNDKLVDWLLQRMRERAAAQTAKTPDSQG